MNNLGVSPYRQAIDGLDPGDKLTTVQGENGDKALQPRQATTSIGGRFVSWVKLHVIGDRQKGEDQAVFRKSLYESYTPEIGEKAYRMANKELGHNPDKPHSLEVRQVTRSLQIAERLLNDKITNPSQQSAPNKPSQAYVEVLGKGYALDQKLHVGANGIDQRDAHTTVGGRVLSWIRLHLSNDTQKVQDQTSFRDAIHKDFGAKGDQAYVSAQEDLHGAYYTAHHSLTVEQVAKTFDKLQGDKGNTQPPQGRETSV